MIDDPQLPGLTKRQEEILSLLIRAYTESPEPVSSKHLVDTFNLGISSATVRNEMSVLEELGYIAAPHTSAGRIPTEYGYRYFVKRLITETDLDRAEKSRIADKLQNLPLATEQWMRLAATVLSRAAHTASLVTPPIAETSRFKHLELISIQGRLVLMVLVLDGGNVHQQMLTLAEPLSQNTLSDTANQINALCQSLRVNDIRIKSVQLNLLGREIAELAVELMEKADSNRIRFIYRHGLSDIINNFPESQGAQQAVRVYEERAFLENILTELLSPFIDHVQVVIAGDGQWEELSHLSMVISRYGIPGRASGAVGVLGPLNVDYARAISSVRYVSGVMTNMLVELYEDGDDDPNATPQNNDDDTP